MLNNLFGVELSYIAQFFLAFVIVLVLIAGTFWLIRRFGANRIGGDKARGRQPRLAVIDAAAVDSRRRLILIRRDNVEHLMMIGGPSDVLIEQNIVRAVPVAPAREAPPTRGPGETVTRGTDLVRPEPPPRPAADTTWSPPAPPEAVRSRTEPAPRPIEPTRPLPESLLPPRGSMSDVRSPAPRASADLQPVEVRQSPPTADVNLSDMAQRLEAALRRPGQAPEPRAEPPRAAPVARPTAPPRTVPAPESIMPPIPRVTPPRPVSPPPEPAPPPVARSAPPPSVPPPAAPPPSAPAPSVEPLRAPDPAPTQAAPQPPTVEPQAPEPPKPEPVPAKPKTVFDSLEEEMASLLGRPPDKS